MTDQPPADRNAELEARIAELERKSWRTSVDQGRSGMETAFWAMVHTLFPEEARKHLKVAGREQLLAARVYLDKWIARLDEEEADAAAGRPHEKIDIE
ncbi:MAG TPA: hypothetical protein VHP64_01475 [Candidatus Limnocylindria bacterium]|jgi:hypothetical protein|nr:hypothetical protein [Candidatus Limnocylindria bacterium]